MDKITIVNKISEGLFESALSNNLVSQFKEDLKFIVFTLKNNNELFTFLTSPFIEYKEKLKTVNQVFNSTLENDMLSFLNLLIEKNLLSYIEVIKTQFEKLSNEHENIIEGTIYTPFELSDNQIKSLELSFSNKLKKTIKFKQKIEKNLIAGIKIILDDTVYEYTINSKLEEAKQNIIDQINKKYNEDGGDINE